MTKLPHKKPKIILLIGQTASGKTQTAIKLAKEINGEVISADSRQVYKGLDIGSDKISKDGMQGVSHHLIDVMCPLTDTYTVSNFVRDASKAIAEIISRGKVPIVAGGTMLYIDALMGKVTVPEVAPDHALRAELSKRSAESLFNELKAKDPRRAAMMVTEGQDANLRRLVRALEVVASLGAVPNVAELSAVESPYDALWLGLTNEPKVQKEKINKRNAQMLEKGLVDEVQQLKDAGVSQKQFDTFGFEYKYPAMYLAGIPIIEEEEPTMEQVLMKMNSGTWRYAKKQRAWWNERDEISWYKYTVFDKIHSKATNFLEKKHKE
jgi:tRNA dimethylallyltransferase